MKIHLYAICWNEVKMLGFFFQHYDPWVDRYIIYDDGSNDGTIDILNAHPRVEVRSLQRDYPDYFDVSKQALQNKIWKESRGQADWVIMVDIDEHLFLPGGPILNLLESYKTKGVTMIPALGYQMVSEQFPDADEHLCYAFTRGAPLGMWNKPAVFNPSAFEETRFETGLHFAKPIGRVKLPDRDELLLLHYKYLGFDNVQRRYQAQLAHLGADQKASFLRSNHQYTWDREKRRDEWNQFAKNAVDISNPDLNPWRSHKEKRWWRPAWKFYANRWVARHRMRIKRSLGIDEINTL